MKYRDIIEALTAAGETSAVEVIKQLKQQLKRKAGER